MALLDRMKDAARTTNRLEAVQTRGPDDRGADRVDPGVLGNPPRAPNPASSGGEAPAYTTEPEAIARAYYVEGRGGARRYYDDYQRKTLAMRAHATAITSKREDLTTIRAMLTLAEARGWSEIKVSGTAAFRREAWIEAQARGLAIQGHKATDLDRQEADRRRREREPYAPRAGTAPGTNEVRPAGSAQASASGPAQGDNRPAPAIADPAMTRMRANGAGREVGGSDATRQQPARASASARAHSAKEQTVADHRTAFRAMMAELSPDGQLVLAALAEKIDRQMSKLNSEAKLETKAFAAAELLKKEKREGPVILSPELRLVATAPNPGPARPVVTQAPPPAPTRQLEPEPARRSRSR